MQCEKNLICRAAFENGGGHEPRDVSILQKLKKARKTDPPPEPPEKNTALRSLGFSPAIPISQSELKHSRAIKSHCFKPLNVLSFVIARIGN